MGKEKGCTAAQYNPIPLITSTIPIIGSYQWNVNVRCCGNINPRNFRMAVGITCVKSNCTAHCFGAFISSGVPLIQNVALYFFSGTIGAFSGTFCAISVLFWPVPPSAAGSGCDAGTSCRVCAACISAVWRSSIFLHETLLIHGGTVLPD